MLLILSVHLICETAHTGYSMYCRGGDTEKIYCQEEGGAAPL